jgi:hypothetical protein
MTISSCNRSAQFESTGILALYKSVLKGESKFCYSDKYVLWDEFELRIAISNAERSVVTIDLDADGTPECVIDIGRPGLYLVLHIYENAVYVICYTLSRQIPLSYGK